ncbi:MAG: hypothetical protein JWO72_139 [Caulobacteraceae bacterium]|nr:hypothetical protein [Caulobacteraceae bacterium]
MKQSAERAGAWTRTSRIIKAPPQALYDAFMDPAAPDKKALNHSVRARRAAKPVSTFP